MSDSEQAKPKAGNGHDGSKFADTAAGPVCYDPWPHGANVRRINLALQGGGAHGAFTWGVLDRLLEEDSIAIDGISGTSAGAVNGAVMAYGLTIGGRETARDLLTACWRRISALASWSPLQPTALDRMAGLGNMDYSPAYWLLEMTSRLMSPYQYNALDINPVRDVLGDIVDFEVLRECRAVKLFVSAVNVKRGRLKIFDLSEISLEAIMASSCLPFLHKAVEVDGEHYWDGGYLGNPAIYPLIYRTDSQDVLVVQINPVNIDEVPTTAQEILDRLNTITFNAGLIREMRAIDFVTRLIEDGVQHDDHLKRMYVHVIDAEAEMQDFGVSSKLNAHWQFLQHLRDLGRAKAAAWLTEHMDDIGHRSTANLAEMYL
jgi:NTE family protein